MTPETALFALVVVGMVALLLAAVAGDMDEDERIECDDEEL